MKLLRAVLDNFGSYAHLEFDFDNQGLALIHGPTGSGKSTLLDAAPWVLYGQTAKGGKVDDIRSWTSDGVTKGTLTVELPSGTIQVTRVRGNTSHENDLYFTEQTAPDTKIRGKDNTETQKLLNQRLCVDFEGYSAAAYACSASPSENFFIASAKSRRELFEHITDLSLPARLLEGAQGAKKPAKASISSLKTEVDRMEGRVSQVGLQMERQAKDCDSWETSHRAKIEKLKALQAGFELEKSSKIAAAQTKYDFWQADHGQTIADALIRINKIEEDDNSQKLQENILKLEAESRCDSCGGVIGSSEKKLNSLRSDLSRAERRLQEREMLIANLPAAQKAPNPNLGALQAAKELINTYSEQLTEEIYAENPYDSQFEASSAEFAKLSLEIEVKIKELKASERRFEALTHLQDLSADLRASLLRTSVQSIQERTNQILEIYFEGAFRVAFTVAGDNLEIEIRKSGYLCSYLQLSKGQRRLLTLSFTVAMMEASANNLGLHFDCIAMDEPTDGLDGDLKTAAYALFEELASKHSTVLVIDHSMELKTLFSKKFRAELVGDHSTLEAE